MTKPSKLTPILKNPESSASSVRPRQEVSFDKIAIHYHSMELGDHPSVSIGAAVTLSWKAHAEEVYDVDVYELYRQQSAPQLQHSIKQAYYVTYRTHLNVFKRHSILRRAGYSEKEIQQGTKQAAKGRRQREITNALGPLNRVENMARSVARLGRRLQQQI